MKETFFWDADHARIVKYRPMAQLIVTGTGLQMISALRISTRVTVQKNHEYTERW